MGNDEHLKKAFKFFDLDKSGYIEIDELRDALADEFDTTSEEVVEAIIYDVDTNKVIRPHLRVNLFCRNNMKLEGLWTVTCAGRKDKLWRVCNDDENGNGLEKSF